MKQYENLNLDSLLSELNGAEEYGLSNEQVEERLIQYGKNTIQTAKKKTILQHLIYSFSCCYFINLCSVDNTPR